MVIFLIVLTVAVLMLVIELFVPGRSWPKVANWWFRAVLLNGVQVGSVFLAGVAWNQCLAGFGMSALGSTKVSSRRRVSFYRGDSL